MRLERHINRLLDTIYSRGDLEIQELSYSIAEDEGRGFITARLCYWDGSLFEFHESLILEHNLVLNKVSYRYHCQRADGTLFARYDDTPHHPGLHGFPKHVHRPGGVEPAEPPDLSEVLREIDGILYPPPNFPPKG